MKKFILFILICFSFSAKSQNFQLNISVDSISFKDENDIKNYIINRIKIDPEFNLVFKDSYLNSIGYGKYLFYLELNGIRFENVNFGALTYGGKILSITGIKPKYIKSDSIRSNWETDFVTFCRSHNFTRIWSEEVNEFVELDNWSEQFSDVFQGFFYLKENKSLDEYTLCYKFQISLDSVMYNHTLFVDTKNLQIILDYNNIEFVNGIVDTRYSGTQNVTVSGAVNQYNLKQIGLRNIQANYSSANADYLDNSVISVNSLLDNDANWTQNEYYNYGSQNYNLQPLLDVYFGQEKFYDFFKNNFNYNSFNGLGTILSGIYSTYPLNNGMWLNDVKRALFFQGDGNTSNPYTSLEVVGHEFGHAIANQHGIVDQNVIPGGISYEGVINESLSDIWGACLLNAYLPNLDCWTVMKQVTVNNMGIRSMSNPKLFNHPDTYNGQYWKIPGSVGYFPHYNAGIMNYWFYLLVNGGSGVNDNNTVYNVPGVGFLKAAQIVFYTETSSNFAWNLDFNSFRYNSIERAKELFGICSEEVKILIDTWNAVGVGKKLSETVAVEIENVVSSGMSDIQYALVNLASTSILESGSFTKYEASYNITLKPGFESSYGSDFHAEIVPCNAIDGGYKNLQVISDNSSVGGRQEVINDLMLYPNPFSDKLYFNILNESVKEIYIVNVLGVVFPCDIIENEIDLSNLNTGTYIFVLQTENNKYSKIIFKR